MGDGGRPLRPPIPGSAPAVCGELNFISAHSYLRLVVGNIFERFYRPKI